VLVVTGLATEDEVGDRVGAAFGAWHDSIKLAVVGAAERSLAPGAYLALCFEQPGPDCAAPFTVSGDSRPALLAGP